MLRTTTLLHALNGDIYWATSKECVPLLAGSSRFLKQAIAIDEAEKVLQDINFDLIFSLDEDPAAARLAAKLNKKLLIGSFLDPSGKVSYTDTAAEWFDMGLISRLGKERADEFKKNNQKTYQEIIFKMIKKEFKGEEYILDFQTRLGGGIRPSGTLSVGIESRADKRWPTKTWNKYEQLADRLRCDGYQVRFFTQRQTVQEYIQDISQCGLIVTGDTLALHIGLALKLNVVALFTCTSPAEIYDYGRMVKVASPLLEKAFYSREYIQEAADAISMDSVYRVVKSSAEGNID